MDPVTITNLVTNAGPALGTVLAVTYFGINIFKWTAEKIILPLVSSIKDDCGKQLTELRDEFADFRREALANQANLMSLVRDLYHVLGKDTKPLDELTKTTTGIQKP